MPITMPETKALLVAARARLAVVDDVQHGVAHQPSSRRGHVHARMLGEASGCQAVPEASRVIA